MKILYKESPRLIALCSDTHSLLFQYIMNKKDVNKNSNNVIVELIDNDKIMNKKGFKELIQKEIYGCLGLINIKNDIFLSVITGAIMEAAKPVEYESVNNIHMIDFICINSSEWDVFNLEGLKNNYSNNFGNINGNQDPFNYGISTTSDINNFKTLHPCANLQKMLSNGSFYFSNDFDLTSIIQHRGFLNEKNRNTKKKKENFRNCRKEFMWNFFMMKGLLKFVSNLDPYLQSIFDKNLFFTVVIRGFAKTILVSSPKDTLTIISKQSWKRAGTRFNARGIDDHGNVANFVETELLYNQVSLSLIFSFVQIRGSAPIFWEQDSTLVNLKINITRSLEATQSSFNKHFSSIFQRHGACHIVNLLSNTKSSEYSITKSYKNLFIKFNKNDEMAFTNFDFHNETKQLNKGFASATKILPFLHNSIKQFGIFIYNTNEQKTINNQYGIFRINCLDCLDRTNLIQQVISQFVLKNILSSESSKISISNLQIESIINKHNFLWADNGDAVSQIYTGTNALKSSFSRSGKMNFVSALSDATISVSRIYQNIFIDGKKQSTLDILLGKNLKLKFVKIYDPINQYVNEKLKSQSYSFTTTKEISIYIGSYNVNGLNDLDDLDLTSWLFPSEYDDFYPDIYAIGLQEITDFNPGSFLNNDDFKSSKWEKILSYYFNSKKEPYVLLRTESIASISLFLFVKKAQIHGISQVFGSSKKTGFGGISSNKGACGVRFEFGLTSFAVVSSHLAAGTKSLLERYDDYRSILNGLIFTRNYTINDHDHIIWFGDLNYRISLLNEYCKFLVEKKQFKELYEADQLKNEIENKGAFYGFKEGKIDFPPTYKFDKGTSDYDTSEKQRVPSWTDRILYLSSTKDNVLDQVVYQSSPEICLSDHKPVFSIFKCKVEFIDKEKKNKLSKNLYENYKFKFNNEVSDLLIEFSDTESMVSKKDAENCNKIKNFDIVSDNNEDSEFKSIQDLNCQGAIHQNNKYFFESKNFSVDSLNKKQPLKKKLPFLKSDKISSFKNKNLIFNSNKTSLNSCSSLNIVKESFEDLDNQKFISDCEVESFEKKQFDSKINKKKISDNNNKVKISKDSQKPIIPLKPLHLSISKHDSQSNFNDLNNVGKKKNLYLNDDLNTKTNSKPQNKSISDWKPLFSG